MNAKTTIRKILFIGIWLCIGGGMLTLLLAAISKKNKGQCKDYSIVIKGPHKNFFIDNKDVEQMLMKAINGNIKGRPVSSYNLHQLEQMLEHNAWIDKAELYFDNQDMLHVSVKEKEPVARIFTTGDNSFYIDKLGKRIPLSDKLSARVPLFTNYPDNIRQSVKDSLLMNDILVTANFIVNHPFWMSQIAQIYITSEGKFEMSPVIGKHIIKLGNGEEIEKKFRRLMMFYQQVLTKTGFDKYEVIDVQYKGQVVALKVNDNSKMDSALLRQNIEKVLQNAREAQDDSSLSPAPIKDQIDQDKNTSANSVKPVLNKQGVKKEKKEKGPETVQPKATMKKKPVEDANGGYN